MLHPFTLQFGPLCAFCPSPSANPRLWRGSPAGYPLCHVDDIRISPTKPPAYLTANVPYFTPVFFSTYQCTCKGTKFPPAAPASSSPPSQSTCGKVRFGPYRSDPHWVTISLRSGGTVPHKGGERWYTQTVGARPCGSLRAQGVQGCHYGQCTQVLGHVFRVRVAFDTELRVPLSSSFSFLFLFFLVSNLGNPPPPRPPPPPGRRPPPPGWGGGDCHQMTVPPTPKGYGHHTTVT